jgi:hypothetical protein
MSWNLCNTLGLSRKECEMKKIIQIALVSSVLAGAFGCSEPAAKADSPVPAAKPVAAKIVIPSGTILKVSLLDALNSDTNSAGDTFISSLTEPLLINGVTVLDKGTQLSGRVIAAEKSGRVEGTASIQLTLTSITQGVRSVPIATTTFTSAAPSTKKRDAEVIAGGAGIGAVIGAIADGKKGAGIGAATGGGAGTGVVLATKGKEVHFGPESHLNFTLTNTIEL